ncbi:hypothetical protein CVT26_005370 [Gymnopilus dilepis]|uniref:DRBM domain-containing protein n=1 Tax=Gymnopilus dilepis TaxID=231916 RepID=A0A409YT60_9AGAR|nr:hypothetical protein CVT26_005370 [Gymnopilus dilepis]
MLICVDLQGQQRLSALAFADSKIGPDNAPQWTSQCKIAVDGVVKGTGTGSTIQDARQNAAREALAVSLHLLARVRRSSYSFRHIIRRLGPEIGTVITR